MAHDALSRRSDVLIYAGGRRVCSLAKTDSMSRWLWSACAGRVRYPEGIWKAEAGTDFVSP